MSKAFVAAVVLVLVLPSAGWAQARGRGFPPPVRNIAGHGIDVPGWWARADKPTATGLMLMPEGANLHAMTGPAAIFWDPQQHADGQYTVKAKFMLNRMPEFEEAYGLFIGGEDLDKDNERLTAFLIREDGSYLIQQRRGMPKSMAGLHWMSSPAIMRPDAKSHQVNELEIHVGADTVSFMVNGKEVASRPRSQVDTDGIAGLRLANDLDVHIDGFAVEK